jgi:hypothetical protein
MAAMLEHLDPVKRRRKQAEMEAQMAALTRHLNKKSDNKKD